MRDFSTPENVMHNWNKGLLGKAEFHSRLIQSLTPENVQSFLASASAELLEELESTVRDAPSTDDEWGQAFSIQSWCGPWNEEIAARVREDERQATKRYGTGVEALRAYFDGNH